MAQLRRMDACLDTLSTELYQVNICVGCITRRQTIIGGFAPVASLPPPLAAFKAEDDDDDDTSKDNDDEDASSFRY